MTLHPEALREPGRGLLPAPRPDALPVHSQTSPACPQPHLDVPRTGSPVSGTAGGRLGTVTLPDLECEILALVAEGKRDPEIALELGLPVGRVAYRIGSITRAFGLTSATRPQLVHLAHEHRVLTPPPRQRPVVLPAEQDHHLRAHIAGETATRYYRSRGLTPKQGSRIHLKLRWALDAKTPAHTVRQAWARQILGPGRFAADLHWARTHITSQRLVDQALVVPLPGSRYRLAVPAGPGHRSGLLALTEHADALAVAAALRGQPSFPDVRIVRADTASAPYAVVWGGRPATPDPTPAPLPSCVTGRPARTA
ncbi:DUF6302 family protein [Streptomyces sp. CSDS2]|uniref:helix-turn-helix transcriptional regulator n=1 Tax=Streptomyces sp. CSDS2 TaxID=3055051 RepID=UPI0025B15A91|nr:DUF6302 family protein [Streptomyces sp. CSDS2]MDN3260813.1 DUF6302 family protein [Streptomyces sp. CSDS2]